MTQRIEFSEKVCFAINDSYCICYHADTRVEVLIRPRLQELIISEGWSHLHPEDLDEVQALYALGFLVKKGI